MSTYLRSARRAAARHRAGCVPGDQPRAVDIARRLDDRFSLFRSERPDEHRHRTLRVVVDWSYELLTPIDRALFNWLCLFGDSFTLEAAETVVADEQLPASYVLDGLSHLVDKSLVQIALTERGTRYRLLDTLRSYGRARLIEAGSTRSPSAACSTGQCPSPPSSKPTCGRNARMRHSLQPCPTEELRLRSNGCWQPTGPWTHFGSSRQYPWTSPPSASGSSTSHPQGRRPRPRHRGPCPPRCCKSSSSSEGSSRPGGITLDVPPRSTSDSATIARWRGRGSSRRSVRGERATSRPPERRSRRLGERSRSWATASAANALWASILLQPNLDEADRMGREPTPGCGTSVRRSRSPTA